MWAVWTSEAVTRATFCPDVWPAGVDSGVELLARHGRIRPTTLPEELHTHLQTVSQVHS